MKINKCKTFDLVYTFEEWSFSLRHVRACVCVCVCVCVFCFNSQNREILFYFKHLRKIILCDEIVLQLKYTMFFFWDLIFLGNTLEYAYNLSSIYICICIILTDKLTFRVVISGWKRSNI